MSFVSRNSAASDTSDVTATRSKSIKKYLPNHTFFSMTGEVVIYPKKPRRVCRPQAQKIQIIFHRDMCVVKNISQAASVEF